jgi:hypothetical protein
MTVTWANIFSGLILFVLSMLAVYIYARLASAAYFRSREDSLRRQQRCTSLNHEPGE